MKLKNNIKNLILVFSLTIAFALIIIIIGIYVYFHPTHYKYNDRFVIGNTYEEIQDRYGVFSHVLYYYGNGKLSTGAYYVGERYDLPEFYIIEFDEDGIAYKVEVDTRDWSH